MANLANNTSVHIRTIQYLWFNVYIIINQTLSIKKYLIKIVTIRKISPLNGQNIKNKDDRLWMNQKMSIIQDLVHTN